MDPAKLKSRPSSRAYFEALKMRPQAKPLAPFNSTTWRKSTQTCHYQRPHVQKCFTVDCFPELFGVAKQEPTEWCDFPCHLFVKYPARVSSEPFQKGTVEVPVCDGILYYYDYGGHFIEASFGMVFQVCFWERRKLQLVAACASKPIVAWYSLALWGTIEVQVCDRNSCYCGGPLKTVVKFPPFMAPETVPANI